jgi:hypothetical protein
LEAVMTHTSDFGATHGKGSGRAIGLAMLAGGLLFAAAAVYWDLSTQHRIIAQSDAETNVAAIVGPPCPVLSAPAFQQAVKTEGPPLPYVFDFNGGTFGRDFGYADCSVAEAKGSLGLGSYNVCQFTSPGLLYVKTSRGQFYFRPGVGKKATVMTPDGVARCVLAAPAETD